MKTLFIPALSKTTLDISKLKSLKKLPKNIAITYSIQYKELAKEIKTILKRNHNITLFSQVLGCSKPNFKKNTKAILLISKGKFHATSLAYESGLPTYLYDNGKFTKIKDSEIESFKRNEKVAYMKYLHAERIGILASSKPGQNRLKQAIKLKKKIKNKKSYIFISNNIDLNEFENFPDVKSWINTACPRLDLNQKAIINADKISKL
jgi:diphthamide biosynthesis enzyme Dph1/Dph2-like protein